MSTSVAIRPCGDADFPVVLGIINDGAEAYRGVIPADRWHEPYMSAEHLRGEIDAGVRFFGLEEGGELLGVMGIQDVGDVTLIRHAYVRSSVQRGGIGGRLLAHLRTLTERPVLNRHVGGRALGGRLLREARVPARDPCREEPAAPHLLGYPGAAGRDIGCPRRGGE